MPEKVSKKKKKWPWVVGSIAVVLIGLVLLVNHQMSSVKSQISQDLSTTTLKRTTLENSISASGSIASGSSVDVTSSLNYVVSKVNVSVGDKVHKGDILAVLDTADLQKTVNKDQQSYNSALTQYRLKVSQTKQSLQDAQDNVSEAQSDLEKTRDNYAGAQGDSAGSVNYKTRYNEAGDKDQATKTASQNLSTAQNNLTQAQNNYDNTVANDTTTSVKEQLQTAKDNLSKATVTAPVSGIVSAVNVSVGNTPSGGNFTADTGSDAGTATTGGTGTAAASAGSSLFSIQSENNFIVKASAADYDVIKLSVGKDVSISVDSTNDAFTGKILTISPVANSSGNYDITASVDSSSIGDLRVGMKTTVKIVLAKKNGIYVVPVDAIVNQNGKNYVVTVDSTAPRSVKKSYVEVATGMETDYYTEVSGSGLKDGLNVLTDPLNKLKTNQPSGGFPGFGGGRTAGGN